MRIIGIAGPAGAGKDTVADHLALAYRFERMAFADPIYRGLAAILDMPEWRLRRRDLKERAIPEIGRSPRELLQTLGTEWGRELVREDIWLVLAGLELEKARLRAAPGVAITDVRFDNEARFVRAAGGQIWHIQRPGITAVRAHASEAGVWPADVDRGIYNDGTLQELAARVDKLLMKTQTEKGVA